MHIQYTYTTQRRRRRRHTVWIQRTHSKRIRQLLLNRKLANEVCNYIHIQFISNLIVVYTCKTENA